MRTVMVRYKTSEAHAAAKEALVHAVFDELREKTPTGIGYTTYRLADGVSFVHVATMVSADGDPLTRLPAFKASQKGIADRCVELPVVTEMSAVDSYAAVS